MPDLKTLSYNAHCGRVDHDCGSYLSPASVTDQAHAMNRIQEIGSLVVNLDNYEMARTSGTLICPFYHNPHHTHFFIAWEHRLPEYVTFNPADGRSAELQLQFGNRLLGLIGPFAQFLGNTADFVSTGGTLLTPSFEVGFNWRNDTIEGAFPAAMFAGSGQNVQATLNFVLSYSPNLGNPNQFFPIPASRPETGQLIAQGGIFSVKMWTYRQ